MPTSDTYTVLREDENGGFLGSGSYGAVHKVVRTSDGKIFARKSIKRHAMSSAYVDSALKEIAVLSKLRHRNIVAYEGSDQTAPGYLHIYMEYCDSGDLEKVMRNPKSGQDYFCQPFSLWEILYQMASALAFCHDGVDLEDPTKTAHRGSVLHRDIKPSNVFFKLNDQGFPLVKLGDFGTAAIITSTLKDPSTYTGTKLYWAPEINREVEENLDYRITKWSMASDVWAMGRTMKAYYQSFQVRVLQPPTAMVDLIDECMSVDPEKRPSAVKVAESCRDMSVGYVDRISATLLVEKTGGLKVGDSRDKAAAPPVSEETQQRLDQFLRKRSIDPSTATDDDLWRLLRQLVNGCHHVPHWVDSHFDENLAKIKEMLSVWQVPRAQPQKMGELLVNACRYCDDDGIELIELILHCNPSLEVRDEHKYTPLFWTIQDKENIAVLLVKHGADPLAEIETSTSRSITPFQHAMTSSSSDSGCIKIIREMLKSPKILPPEKGRKGALTKLLMSAADQHKPKVVHLLVTEFGATGNVSEYLRGMMSLLQYAAHHKDIEMAQFLLDQGCDIHGLPINDTPLQFAARNGDDVMVRLFLNHGADPNRIGEPKGIDAGGPSPLQAAIEAKNHGIARMLIEAGADPNKGSKRYYTALTIAAMKGDEESVHTLLDAGVNPTSKDYYTGCTPLSWAAREKHMNVFKILLDATTDVPSSAPSSLWPLCQWDHCAEAVKMLLERGVGPDSYRYDKTSMLVTATRCKAKEIMRLLVEHGASPDDPGDYLGRTPRMLAEETFDSSLIDALNGDD